VSVNCVRGPCTYEYQCLQGQAGVKKRCRVFNISNLILTKSSWNVKVQLPFCFNIDIILSKGSKYIVPWGIFSNSLVIINLEIPYIRWINGGRWSFFIRLGQKETTLNGIITQNSIYVNIVVSKNSFSSESGKRYVLTIFKGLP